MNIGSLLASRNATPANISEAALKNLSEILVVHQAQVALALVLQESYVKQSLVNVTLSSLSSGSFTVLAAVAAYVLCSRGIKRKAVASMLIAVIVMWMSALAYWIAILLAAAETYSALHDLASQNVDQAGTVLRCALDLRVDAAAARTDCQQEQVTTLLYSSLKTYNIHDCIGTTALTVNVVIGDSIVWWRAWVLWPDNRVVRSICAIVIMLTTLTGVLDTKDACRMQAAAAGNTIPAPQLGLGSVATRGTMFSGDAWGIAAGLSSFLTNAIATSLIAYRAWEHRRVVMSYLRGQSRRTQVERTLALLVESGLLYCALWLTIVVYELSSMSLVPADSVFANRFYYVMEGCAVALIGMYPTLVIIMCAVDKSRYEKASDDDGARNVSIVFAGGPSSRPRGTLSELVSATSAYVADEDIVLPPGNMTVEMNGLVS
ncbi:hypothetical protein OH76DRAFT_144034 [Lentinus brumalis]|uniref:Uncharacterized protein n=1 Tax=Lentinus brumalis TaxID=2498619 RepID=A0A371CP80_9APHY|nr:hypothetical protein OH76DRAFT_144034 [Polyporus brumalis]